jgi:competence protein ComEC
LYFALPALFFDLNFAVRNRKIQPIMIHWKTIPLVILALAFGAGIIVFEYLQVPLRFLVIGIACSTLCIIGMHRLSDLKVYFAGISIALFMLMGGYWYTSHQPEYRSSHYSHFLGEENTRMLLSVRNTGKTQKGKTKVSASVLAIQDNEDRIWQTSGNILIYTDIPIEEIAYGATAWVRTSPKPIPENLNPHSFDYKAFLAKQHIHYQGYVRSTAWNELEIFTGNPILRFAHQLQDAAQKKLDQQLQDSIALGVATALILGDKSLLQEDIRQDYALTGASHVLAVSGLHCGIIAGLLLYLLQFIRRQSLAIRLIKVMMALLGLWLFALVTGLAPSVMRASIMFSFLLVGRLLLYRSVNLYNIIALSALLMMLHDPMIVFNISFQLSYSALIGIIALQDRLYRMVYLPHAGLNKIWELMTVSIAAQIGTLPFTLHYFHLFPFYFWLSGIAVVPLAAVILKSGMLTLVLSFWSDEWGSVPAWILHKAISIMNVSVEACRKLPAMDTTQIYLNPFQLLLLSLTIGSLILGWSLYSKRWLKMSLICFLGLSAATCIKSYQQSSQYLVQSYAVEGDVLIDIYQGTKCMCYTNIAPDDPRIQRLTEENRGHHGISDCIYEYINHDTFEMQLLDGDKMVSSISAGEKAPPQRFKL